MRSPKELSNSDKYNTIYSYKLATLNSSLSKYKVSTRAKLQPHSPTSSHQVEDGGNVKDGWRVAFTDCLLGGEKVPDPGELNHIKLI